MTLAVGLDLGTTRIKGGLLQRDGSLEEVRSRPAPPLEGEGMVRESSADAYRREATGILDALLDEAPLGVQVGLASQRSTFVIWESEGGAPVTPLISWQDRRAADWCELRRDRAEEITRLTGLPLSPHYAGPKLAALLEAGGDLANGLGSGTLRFGTLETYLLWHWSGGRRHETDATMAARTAMVDLQAGAWSDPLLDLFGVPSAGLPEIVPSYRRSTLILRDSICAASIADQAAAAVAVLGAKGTGVLVNLGTGGFVLVPTGDLPVVRAGYLTGPILGAGSDTVFGVEGTINGAGPAADRFAAGPTGLPEEDPGPEAFCLPDLAGVGSPHWLPDRRQTFSEAAADLEGLDRRRIVLEGILFRVREILEDLRVPGPLRLCGGLARDPFLGAGMAACLGRPVEVVEEADATLLGAASLASGLEGGGPALSARTFRPGPPGGYLRPKFARWKSWLAKALAVKPG